MAPVAWATPDQVEFLGVRLPAFQSAQREKTTPTFWTEIYRDFFSRWPTQSTEIWPLDVPKKKRAKKTPQDCSTMLFPDWVALRKNQIANWYNNRGSGSSHRRSGPTIVIGSGPSSQRVPSELHLYSRAHYEEKIRPRVMAAVLNGNIDAKQRIAIVNRCTADAWAVEDEDIKKAIRAEHATLKLTIKQETGTPQVRQPADAILVLPDAIKAFFNEMARRTGWAFSVLAGGPDVNATARIRTIAIHHGEDRYEQIFSVADPNFYEHVLTPFRNFLFNVYPEDAIEEGTVKENDTEEDLTEEGEKKSNSLLPDSGTTTCSSLSPAENDSNLKSASPILGDLIVATPASPENHVPGVLGLGALLPDHPYAPGPGLPSTDVHPAFFGAPFSYNQQALRLPSDCNTTFFENSDTPLPEHQIDSALFDFRTLEAYRAMGPLTDVSGFWGPFLDSTGGDIGMPITGLEFQPPAPGLGQVSQSVVNTTASPPSAIAAPPLIPGPPPVISAPPPSIPGPPTVIAAPPPTIAVPPPTIAFPPPAIASPPPAIASTIAFSFPQANTACPPPAIVCPSTVGNGQPSLSPLSNPMPAAATVSAPAALQTRDVNADSDDKDPMSVSTGGAVIDKNSRPPRSRRPALLKEVSKPMVWLERASEYMAQDIESESWKTCTRLWLEFETKEALELDTSSIRIPAKGRPALLSKWTTGRKNWSSPMIPDKNVFASEWVVWWNSIQPAWRKNLVADGLPLSFDLAKGKDSMLPLRRGGPTGLVVVLIGLKWWAHQDGRWNLAVDDLIQLFEFFSSLKRKAPEEDQEKAKGKSKKTKKVKHT